MVELAAGAAGGTTASRRSELLSVQYLRAAASLFVVAWHAGGEVGIAPWNVLQSGIEFFFLISGFVIWTISLGKPVDPLRFLGRRVARVVPFYWAITTVVVALLLARPQWVQTLRFDLPHVIASYLFVPWPNPTPGVDLKPLVIPGWTLNYEMAFYILFAACLFLPARRRAVWLVGILLALPVAGIWLGRLSDQLAFYTAPVVAELGFGVVLAVALTGWTPRPSTGWALLGVGTATLVAGAALWDGHGPWRLALMAGPAALVTAGLLGLERAGRLPRSRLLKSLGDASYALYMVHPLMLSAMAQLWRHTPAHQLPGGVFVALSLVATSLAGLLVRALVEKPLTEALQRGIKFSSTRRPVSLPSRAGLTRMLKNQLWIARS